MYQMGEFVVYGVHGVCLVSQIQERRVDRMTQQYLRCHSEPKVPDLRYLL